MFYRGMVEHYNLMSLVTGGTGEQLRHVAAEHRPKWLAAGSQRMGRAPADQGGKK